VFDDLAVSYVTIVNPSQPISSDLSFDISSRLTAANSRN
jgi:hypothetical protein